MKSLKGWIGVLLIFCFGVVVGAALSYGAMIQKFRRMLDGSPEKVGERVAELVAHRLQVELQLDPSQKEQLQKIADETRAQLRALRQESQPKTDQTLGQAAAKVRAMLKPDQIPKFEEILRRTRPGAAKNPPPANSR